MAAREYSSLQSALKEIFPGNPPAERGPGGTGGCINSTSTIKLRNGKVLFIKENSSASALMFSEEARGLEALAAFFPLKVPRPLAYGTDRGTQFLILENIKRGTRKSGFWEQFGRALAQMHRATGEESFGFVKDNYIGSTRQVNDRMDCWTSFFAEKRLFFQLELAVSRGLADKSVRRGVESICSRIGGLLPEPDHPSLLHGDLWSGNFMVDDKGEAVLIDPAVYYGHCEADLAMTELFGGFDRRFYNAYEDVSPLVPGYSERRDLYNLYHMLNHLNLFGSSYSGSVRSIISRYA